MFSPDVSGQSPSSASTNNVFKGTTIPVGQVLYAAPRTYSIRESDKHIQKGDNFGIKLAGMVHRKSQCKTLEHLKRRLHKAEKFIHKNRNFKRIYIYVYMYV